MGADTVTVIRVGRGVYWVVDQGRAEIVYVAGPADDPWAFWNGRVYRGRAARAHAGAPRSARGSATGIAQSLTAPMPATVLKVLVQPGAAVRSGDTLVVLEAMKMELPLRASGDAVVATVHCREGELVQPNTVLVELS